MAEGDQITFNHFDMINRMHRDIGWRLDRMEERQRMILSDPVRYRAFGPLHRTEVQEYGEKPRANWRTHRRGYHDTDQDTG